MLLTALITFIAGFGIIALILALFIPLVLYILFSYGLYTMALAKGLDYPWLAWIPIVQLYIFGEIIRERVFISTLMIPFAQIILPVAAVCSGAFAAIPYVGWIIAILMTIYNYAAYYRLYKLYSPNNAVLFLVLSIILPFMPYIFVFVLRNKSAYEYTY